MIINTVYTCKQCSSHDLNEKQLNKPMILFKDETLYKKWYLLGYLIMKKHFRPDKSSNTLLVTPATQVTSDTVSDERF